MHKHIQNNPETSPTSAPVARIEVITPTRSPIEDGYQVNEDGTSTTLGSIDENQVDDGKNGPAIDFSTIIIIICVIVGTICVICILNCQRKKNKLCQKRQKLENIKSETNDGKHELHETDDHHIIGLIDLQRDQKEIQTNPTPGGDGQVANKDDEMKEGIDDMDLAVIPGVKTRTPMGDEMESSSDDYLDAQPRVKLTAGNSDFSESPVQNYNEEMSDESESDVIFDRNTANIKPPNMDGVDQVHINDRHVIDTNQGNGPVLDKHSSIAL